MTTVTSDHSFPSTIVKFLLLLEKQQWRDYFSEACIHASLIIFACKYETDKFFDIRRQFTVDAGKEFAADVQHYGLKIPFLPITTREGKSILRLLS